MARAKRRAASATRGRERRAVAQVQVPVVGAPQADSIHRPNFTWRAPAPCDTAAFFGAPVMRAASLAASLGASASSSSSSTASASTLRRRRLLGPRLEHQHELALAALGARGEPAGRLAERQPRHLLELLRQLAADRELARRRRSARRGRPGCRRCGAAPRREPPARAHRAPRSALRRAARVAGRKPAKRKRGAAKPEDRERGGRRARPGQRAHADAGAVRLAHQPGARIGQRRRAGVADQRDRLSFAQRGDQPRGGAALVVLVQGDGARRRCRGARAACAWCACPRRR